MALHGKREGSYATNPKKLSMDATNETSLHHFATIHSFFTIASIETSFTSAVLSFSSIHFVQAATSTSASAAPLTATKCSCAFNSSAPFLVQAYFFAAAPSFALSAAAAPSAAPQHPPMIAKNSYGRIGRRVELLRA